MSWTLEKKVENEGPPPCFGKTWDKLAPECAGGRDPAYKEEKVDKLTGEITVSHIRPACGYFNDCGSRMQASRMAQQLIPATSLARAWNTRPAPTTVPNPQPVGGAPPQQAIQQFSAQQLQQQFLQMQQQMMAQQMEMARRGQAPMMPMMPGMPGFQQMMPVNFEIPQYLTRREHRQPNESVFKTLSREVFRSMLKSAGHTFANFWDSTAFFEPPKE